MVDPTPRKRKQAVSSQSAIDSLLTEQLVIGNKNKKRKTKQSAGLEELPVVDTPMVEQEPVTRKKKKRKQLVDSEKLPATGKPAVGQEPKVGNTKKTTHSTKCEKSLVAGKLSKNRPHLEKSPAPDEVATEHKLGKKKKKRLAQEAMTVILGGLPFTCTDAMLTADFGKFGGIQKVNVPKDLQTGRARGFAFITFKTKAGVEAALGFHGREYNGRKLTARLASDGPGGKGGGDAHALGKSDSALTVFVGGLPHEVKEKSIRRYFSDGGNIEAVKLPLNELGKPRGYAFVTFKDKESLEKALELNGGDFKGRSIVVRISGTAKGQGKDSKGKGMGKGQGKDKGAGKGPVELTVFVQGLARSTTEQQLRKAFSKCGEITHLKLPMWSEGESRGFAFISYADKAAVDMALKTLDGNDSMSYKDCYMSVKKALDHGQATEMKQSRQKPREDRKDKVASTAEAKPAKEYASIEAKESGALVTSTGKRIEFDSSDSE